MSKAISMSRITIEKEPYNATYLDTYAWVMYRSNNLSEAEKYIRRRSSTVEARIRKF